MPLLDLVSLLPFAALSPNDPLFMLAAYIGIDPRWLAGALMLPSLALLVWLVISWRRITGRSDQP